MRWTAAIDELERGLLQRDVAARALLLAALVLVVPLSVAMHYAIREASEFVRWAVEANRHGAPVPAWIEALPFIGPQLAMYWREHLSEPQALNDVVGFRRRGADPRAVARAADAATRLRVEGQALLQRLK